MRPGVSFANDDVTLSNVSAVHVIDDCLDVFVRQVVEEFVCLDRRF